MITSEEAIRRQIDFLRYTRKYTPLNDPAYARLSRDIRIFKHRLKHGIKRPGAGGVMMYEIRMLENISEPYIFCFESEKEATDAAYRLALKHKRQVNVMKVVKRFVITIDEQQVSVPAREE
jgi:hypothetical protein